MIRKLFLSLLEKVGKERSLLNRDSLSYLLVFLLPTQLGLHFWPDFAFVNGIRIDYLSPTLYLTDVVFFFLLISSILKREINLRTFSPYASLFFAIVLIGIILSSSPLAGLYYSLKILEMAYLAIYVFKRLDPNKAALVLSLSLLLQSFIALGQFVKQGSIGGILYLLGERTFNIQTPNIAKVVIDQSLILRPYGTLPHPNVLAAFILIGMAIIILYFKPITKNHKALFYLSLILGNIGLLVSMSRVAVAVWLVTLPYLLIVKVKNKKLFIAFTLCAAAFILALPFSSRFTEVALIDQSLVERKIQMDTALEIIKDNFVLGVGLNNYLNNVPVYTKSVYSYFFLQPVHNSYLLILSQVGVVSFLIIAAYSVKLFKLTNNNLKIVLLVVFTLGLFDHYFLTLQQGQLLLSLIIGLSIKKA